ncbi:MAG: dUTP diphosphatase [Mycoplasmataceae bacterium]|jgi:dimeric dUTPase (all-alpha-NTP-PPase superfamily)|nr:dUTP diphosphatase [Mycoplasmataceae bacterium]
MQLNLDDIIEAQKILDQTIQAKHRVDYPQILEELKLALFTELAELANEVRSFKFWSIKPSSDKSVILEEYVDGIHFISSLSIAMGVNTDFFLPDNIPIASKKDLTIIFNKLFSQMNALSDLNGIHDWFREYLILGYQLGFTYADIYQAYFKKNQINFKRQEENY